MAVLNSWRRLVVPTLLCCVGIGLVFVGLFADSVGLGDSGTGFGSDQKLAVLLGVLTLAAGVLLGYALLGSPVARRVLLFAVMLLFTVAVVEAVGRLVVPIPQVGYAAWAGYPRSELLLKIDPDEFEAVHRYNRFGFRGEDFPLERGDAEYRIACVGDSFTEGVGAAEDATWPAVVGQELEDLKVQVLNLGDSGSGPDRYAQICAEAAFALRPTDLIVCILPSDFSRGLDHLPALDSPPELPDPFHERSFGVGLMARLMPTWLYLADSARGKWPVQSGLYWTKWSGKDYRRAVGRVAREERFSLRKARAVVKDRLRSIEPAVLEAAKKGHFNPGWIELGLASPHLIYRVRVEDMRIEAKDLEGCVEAWVTWFASHCEQFQIRPWVLYFPQPPQVVDGPFGPYTDAFYRKNPPGESLVGENSFAILLGRVCRQHEVKFIDATEILMRHNDQPLYLRYDCHPNARAYEVVGKYVAGHMRRRIPSMNSDGGREE